MKKTFTNTVLELVVGNIIQQPEAEAIVNAANAQLRTGGGVAGAIHGAGDPKLEQLTRPLAPIKPGEAVITEAPNLPNSYVIHCLGPVYGRDEPSDVLLANCYVNALNRAKEHGVNSVAFPAISTGAFGYPMKEAARVAFQTIRKEAQDSETPDLIRFVMFDDGAYQVHRSVLDTL